MTPMNEKIRPRLPGRRRKLDEDTEHELARRYHLGHDTIRVLADEFGVSTATVIAVGRRWPLKESSGA